MFSASKQSLFTLAISIETINQPWLKGVWLCITTWRLDLKKSLSHICLHLHFYQILFSFISMISSNWQGLKWSLCSNKMTMREIQKCSLYKDFDPKNMMRVSLNDNTFSGNIVCNIKLYNFFATLAWDLNWIFTRNNYMICFIVVHIWMIFLLISQHKSCT